MNDYPIINQLVDCRPKDCRRITNFSFTNKYEQQNPKEYFSFIDGNFVIEYDYTPKNSEQKFHVHLEGKYIYNLKTYHPEEKMILTLIVDGKDYQFERYYYDIEGDYDEDEYDPYQDRIMRNIFYKYGDRWEDLMKLQVQR